MIAKIFFPGSLPSPDMGIHGLRQVAVDEACTAVTVAVSFAG